ncbi:CBS domain-containing protein [Streptomyces sp. NPDC047000]|uniref:CBS domain-containing protein n=1 Tax=Streptomyces sp. NPDC047000 TaxID=3155474 RepID=UPI003409A461
MNDHEKISAGGEARSGIASRPPRPGETGRQDMLLRYLGAVAAASAEQAEARQRPATGDPGVAGGAVRVQGRPAGQRPPRVPAESLAPLLVRDVMDVPAASMHDDLPYRQIARLLAREGVGAIPVVDAHDHVVGVVSESDLLAKVAFEASGHRPGPIGRLRERRLHGKARGESAADLMTAPAITVLPGATVAEAAWLAALSRLKRLPVADHDGRLVGVVRREALLRALIRDDEGIREEVESVVVAVCSPAERTTVQVKVRDGVVDLTGRAPAATAARLVAEIEAAVEDVVEVNDHLVTG